MSRERSPDAAGQTWSHGCDACAAAAPVEYVPPLGYLCAFCRRPESLEDLRCEIQRGTRQPDPVGEMTDIDLERARDHYRLAERERPLSPSWAQRYAEIVTEIDKRKAAALPPRTVEDWGDQ